MSASPIARARVAGRRVWKAGFWLNLTGILVITTLVMVFVAILRPA